MNRRQVLSTLTATALLSSVAAYSAAAQPIKVGAALSQTGQVADSAEHVRKALVLWQDTINAAGGMLGRKVELVMYDDRSDPGTAARLYERLITSDNVDLLIAPFGSAATATASAVTEKHRRVLINEVGASEQIHARGFKYIFQVVAPIDAYPAGIFPVAQAAGLKTLMFVGRDFAGARDMEKTIRAQAPKFGIEVKAAEYFPAGSVDYSSYIIRARSENPDIWVTHGIPNEPIEMIKQMQASNYLPKMFVGNGVAQEDFVTATGKAGEYAFGMSLYEPELKTKGNEAFVKAFQARWNYLPGYYSALGWAAGEILAEAVKRAGSTDQEKLREVLSKLEMETVFGPYKVDETGAQIAKKALLVQVRNGKREIVWPNELQSARPVLPAPAWSAR